jgi:tetratricopeptide (TPR) repeat protein
MQTNRPGRNDPCPCGSGKKYKKCCGLKEAEAVSPPVLAEHDSPTAGQIEHLAALFAEGKLAELAQGASALLRSYPEAGILWKLLGLAQRRLGANAVEALKRAALLLPGDAEVWNLMGSALRDAGELDNAETSYLHALKLRPDFAEAHCNLGLTLCDLGRAGEGEVHCRRALVLKPHFVIALNNLGLALREQGKLDEALASYQEALRLQPGLAELHHNVGNVFEEQNRFDEAAASYRRATELNPRYFSAYVNVARMMRRQGDNPGAAQLCAEVLKAEPGFGPALMLEYELHADAGRFDAAEAALRLVDAASPSYPDAWGGIPYLRKMRQEDGDWLAGARELVARRLSPRAESLLRFAMGKYFDDIGACDEAFDSYRRAHELARSFGITYKKQAQQPAIDTLLHAFGQDWMARRRGTANISAKPILVVGMPRSGTSLVEQILASHPAVFGAGELDFWRDESQALLASGEEVGDEALGACARRYLHLLEQLAPEASRVVDKMPGNFLYLGLIHGAFPNARVIHMQRDPIDTCLSIYFQRLGVGHPYANDLDDLAHAYRMYRYTMAQWEAVLPKESILHLPYEALVSDQEIWTRKLLEFVDLPWDPRCLDFHLQQREVGTASNWQVRQKMNKSAVERWRRYEKHIAPLLALRGNASPVN